MTNKNKLYYAEIRIIGFDDKRNLVEAIQDAVERVAHYSPPAGDIEIEIEEFKESQVTLTGSGWLPVKLPKRLVKTIEKCFGSVKL